MRYLVGRTCGNESTPWPWSLLFSHSFCNIRSLKTNWKCTKTGKKSTICSVPFYHRLQGPMRPPLDRKPQKERQRCWRKTSQKHAIDAELHYQDYKGKTENSCNKLLKIAGSDKLLCSREDGKNKCCSSKCRGWQNKLLSVVQLRSSCKTILPAEGYLIF